MGQKCAQTLENRMHWLWNVANRFERGASEGAGRILGVLLLALGSATLKSLRPPALTREDLSYKGHFTMVVK
jgi:hypothetical protein